jgi:Fe2+ or Zn2+ uptake regulation protein
MARTTTAEFVRNRAIALERDENQCVNCGRGDELHCHHIEPAKDGGSDHHTNLVTLCYGCHNWLHRIGREGNSTELLTPDLLGEWTPAEAAVNSDFRHPDLQLTGCDEAIIDLLRGGGEVELSEIVERTDYTRSTIHQNLRRLRIAGYVDRTGRGLYAYVPPRSEDPRETND